MRTVTVDQHTFIPELLTEQGWVIDAGCRGFNFSDAIAEHKPRFKYQDFNYKIYCLDIEQFEKPNNVTVFKQAALTNYNGQVDAYYFGNGTGNFIRPVNEAPGNTPDRPCETKTIPAITLQYIYKEIGTDIDLLKLDIEGSEYFVLDKFEPIPKQITVEFHEHCHTELHQKHFDEIFKNLCKHYNAALYITEWPQYKYMDCLFIRKDLI